MNLGEKMTQLRRSDNLTQVQLAENLMFLDRYQIPEKEIIINKSVVYMKV